MSRENLQAAIASTGASGSRGISLEAARGCAEIGAEIAITYTSRREEAESNASDIAKEYGVQAKAYHLDMTDYDAVQRFVKAVVDSFGQIHAFIATAGTAKPDSVVDTTKEDWDRIVAANLNVTASMSAHIINVPQEIGSYSAAKAGSVHLAKKLAVEWREFARVNVVPPGYVDTGLADFSDQETQNVWKSMIPLGRQGTSQELKGAYVYFASDASSYTTGAEIVIDGGHTVQ